jgi:hypothetical protein
MRTTSFFSIAALTVLTTTQMAWAADDDASATAAARNIGTEGLRLAEAGNCKDAVEKLDRAEKLHHAPTTLGKLGECQIQIGRIVAGLESLRKLIREPIAADAPPAFHAAKSRAQKIVEESQGRIAQLRISVTLPSGVTPQITVDGEPVSAVLVDQERPTDPGTHTIEATADRYKKATTTITLKEGDRQSVSLVPEFDPTAPVPVANNGSNGSSKETIVMTPQPRPGWVTGAWVVTGILAAGAITTGIITMTSSSSLSDARKNEPTTGAALEDKSSSTKTFALVTDGLAAGAIILGAVSLYFTLKTRPAVAAPASGQAAVRLGLGRLDLVGQF